jgi:hypothetical protein
MGTNIYPKNYFTPYDDLQEYKEDPIEDKADKQAALIIERLHKLSVDKSKGIFHPTDFRTMYYKFLNLAELEFAELLEHQLKLEENE